MMDQQLAKFFSEAMSRQAAGDRGGALLAYKRIQRHFPGFVDAWINASTLLCGMERFEEALGMAEAAVGLDEANEAAVYALADARIKLGRLDEAEASLLGLIERAPTHFQAIIALAAAYAEKKRFAESLALYDRAAGLDPSNAPLLARRGMAKMKALDVSGAESDFRSALGLGFDNDPVRMQLAISLLLQHRYREAWKQFGSKMVLGATFQIKGTAKPRWRGEPLHGGALLVGTHHHGFGDAIQLSRLMPLAKEAAGGRVLLSAHEPLKRLLGGVPGIDGLVDLEEQVPDFDAHIGILELPIVLDIEASALPPPIDIPAPGAPPPLGAAVEGFKVGLNLVTSLAYVNDSGRSIDPRLLDELADVEGAGRIAWYGLQKPPSQEPPRLPGFADVSSRMGDFMDTAQMVRQMDLVVTVDTAMAHLAGSLRVPTLVLLTRLPDWRWGLGGTTPWYPTVRLLRQPAHGDWRSVVAMLKSEIAGMMDSRSIYARLSEN
jgi:tetratricopeptide (TPR) repeat protein